MTTDGYVVSPLFLPGGDIGSLRVHGTVNDVAMAGASAPPLRVVHHRGGLGGDPRRIVRSMAHAAREAGASRS